MRLNHADRVLGAVVTVIGWLTLVAAVFLTSVAHPAVRHVIENPPRYTAKRGSSNMAPTPASIETCRTQVRTAIRQEGETRTSGSIVYQCIITESFLVSFQAAPVTPQPANCVVSEWSAWSDDGAAWSACTSGQQTRRAARTRAVITPASNGGTACPPLTEERTDVRGCVQVGSAKVNWSPPVQNTDGSALTNLAGYRVHYGRSAAELVHVVQIANPAVVSYTIDGLAPGTWYFAVRAYSTSGGQSTLSGVAPKIIL